MKKHFYLIAFLFLSLLAQAQEQKLNPGGMKTAWGEKVTPANAWRQYPRPQLVRSEWLNLNGNWDYAIVSKNASQPKKYEGKMLVPFCAESSLSGVGKLVKPDQKLWYNRQFQVPGSWKGKNVILHFDAVDWETTVWLNGKKVGEHKGGSDPFAFDITRYLKRGDQQLVVSVWDPTDTGMQPRGKQVLNPRGIWYTPVTGIWQTVWLEPVSKTHIKTLVPEANIDDSKVVIKNQVPGATGKDKLVVRVLKDNKLVAEKTGAANAPLEISLPQAERWTPYNPSLYQLEVQLVNGSRTLDQVKSYFAMRKISVGKDALGFERLLLNNQPLFQYGTLDQGWWPDGLLTPPSDEAMRFDMDVLKKMGFNMLRKHIKVEPSRYYYYADSLGLLVWQDMPSGFESDKDGIQAIRPEATEDWVRPAASARQFEQEWKSIMDHLRFFPSIVVWVPFNEGWGQYDTKRIVDWTQQYDPSRVVNGVSGWTDRKVGPIYDAHHYPGPGMEPAEQNPGRVMVLGEFGGLGWPVPGHIWNPNMRNWGYRTYQTNEVLVKEYARLMYNLYPMINRGLSAAIYTQTTDVEGEVNGLMTYDRKKIKMDPELMRILHNPLYNKAVKASFLVWDSELSPQSMFVSSQDPLKDNKGEINGSAFAAATGPLMLEKGDQRWAYRTFNLGQELPKNLQLRLLGHGDVNVYLNGRLVADKFVNAKRHYDELNLSDYDGYLKAGENMLLVEMKKVGSKGAFDFGLYTF